MPRTQGDWMFIEEKHESGNGLTIITYAVRPVYGTPTDNVCRTSKENAMYISMAPKME